MNHRNHEDTKIFATAKALSMTDSLRVSLLLNYTRDSLQTLSTIVFSVSSCHFVKIASLPKAPSCLQMK
jgi:hypothetical protein